MKSRSRRTTVIAGVGILLITVVTLEALVRVWGYSRGHLYDPIYEPFKNQEIPYVHKPNLVQAQARGLAIINTDSLGLRAMTGGAVYGAKQAGEYRIAIVGDSFTFGEGIQRTEDTFAHVLETRLNHKQASNVRVFNYGTSAYSVKEMTAVLKSRMLAIEPDLVLLAIIPTDFNLSRTPTIDDSGYLIDQNLSLIPSMAQHILRGIHLMYVLRDIALRFSHRFDIIEILSRGELPESYRYIQQFKDIAEQHSLAYAILLLPWVPWGAFPNQLAHDGITYCDLSFLLDEFTQAQYMATRFDPHPSVAVHSRIGDELAEYVVKNHLRLERPPFADLDQRH